MMITEFILDNEIEIYGWPFKKAFDICNNSIEDIKEDLLKSVGGVYAVTIHDEIIYIGKYSDSLQYRWINKLKNSNCMKLFRHFKGDLIAEMAQERNTHASVYVLTYDEIQRITGNEWISHHSIEERLITLENPLLNTHFKEKKRAK